MTDQPITLEQLAADPAEAAALPPKLATLLEERQALERHRARFAASEHPSAPRAIALLDRRLEILQNLAGAAAIAGDALEDVSS